MKMLNEVIKDLEECMTDDAIESEGLYLAIDALFYLKEYQDMIKKLENYQKENQRLKKKLRNWKVMLLGMPIIDVGMYRGCGNEYFG